MRNLFPGHYRYDEAQFTELWKNAVFVLDTNVLLNLYRYPKEAHDDLLSVFRRVSDRLWLPHQAALEYQWNRPSEIAEQVRKYNEVRKIVQDTSSELAKQLGGLNLKRRHSTIKTDQLTKDVGDITSKFLDELKVLESQQPDVSHEDKLRDEIDELLTGKVGHPPQSQQELDEIYKDGEERYKRRCPPGYMDAVKSKDQIEVYTHNGLVFRRDYGDLILWYQIIAEAKARGLKYIIFVTDDEKEDWWWKKDSRGEKTLGARPELIEEITKKADVTLFYMYTSRGFLKWAKTYLDVEVKDESIEQIRDISRVEKFRHKSKYFERIIDAVAKWLQDFQHRNDTVFRTDAKFPDFVVINSQGGLREGYEVIVYEDFFIPSRIREKILESYHAINEKNLDRVILFFVTESESARDQLSQKLNRFFKSTEINLSHIHTLIGVIKFNSDTGEIELEVGVG